MLRRGWRATVMGASAAVLLAPSAWADGPDTSHRPFSWTGFYVGGLATYVSTDSKHCDAGTCAIPGVVYPDFGVTGGLGGIAVGYNVQTGKWVAGVELDWSWGDADGSSPGTASFGCAGDCTTSIRSIGTFRFRLGYALDRFLPYVTAGVAVTEYHASIGTPVLEDSRSKATFTAGLGLEYALTRHWSAKAEYLFIDGAGDFLYTSLCAAPGCFARTDDIHTLRLGVNYKF